MGEGFKNSDLKGWDENNGIFSRILRHQGEGAFENFELCEDMKHFKRLWRKSTLIETGVQLMT